MDVDFDFSDVSAWFDGEKSRVLAKEREIGDDAVQYAKDNGSYQDHTETLRKSNEAEVGEEGILLKNEAESPKGYYYASDVEDDGFDVLGNAALYTRKRGREEFE